MNYYLFYLLYFEIQTWHICIPSKYVLFHDSIQ